MGDRVTPGAWRWRTRLIALLAILAVAVVPEQALATPVEPAVTVEPTPGDVEVDLPEHIDDEDAGEIVETDALDDVLAGFGDVPQVVQDDVASDDLVGVDIPDGEQPDARPDPVVELERSWDILEVDGDGNDGVVNGLESVTLQEAVTSASGGESIVPTDTAVRGDLLAPSYPRAGSGDGIMVETIPADDLTVQGAAFALRLTAEDPDADALWVGMELDISGVRYAHGGDYGGRLELQVFPECVLTTPEDPSCSTGVPILSKNSNGETLTGVVPADAGNGVRLEGVAGFGGFRNTKVRSGELLSSLAATQGLALNTSTGQGTIVMAVAGVAGPGGTFAKTDLKPVGSWSVGESQGTFSYSVPLEVPPVEAGPVPDLTLGYNSAAIDGHTPASNGQSSWIADGWGMEFGYIERQYTSCTAEGFSTSGFTMASGLSGFNRLYAAGDWNGDGNNDLVALKTDGTPYLFLGDGAGGLQPGTVFGSSWNSLTLIVFPGDFSGDGYPDMIGRTSNGDLWLYKGDGNTGWLNGGAGTKNGTGWNIYVELMAPGDFTSDGKADLIGRDSSGVLWLYRGNGGGAYAAREQIGTGFQVFSRHITPGDWSGDGKVDIISVWPNGTPEMYKGNGSGGWLSGSGFAVGGAWSTAINLVGSRDLNGDGKSDLVELSGGTIRLFPGAGNGHGQTSKGNDLCWAQAFDSNSYTVGGQPVAGLTAEEKASYVMSLGGASYQLFPVGGNLFKTSPDTGIVVERNFRTANANGDDTGEYFRVWTPDGGVYYFGFGHNGSTATNSVATVQARANDGAPECSGTCQQAYRWMLDIEVDAAKNAMVYTYLKETNKYAQAGGTTYNTYTSAIYPLNIEYGGRFTGTWDAPAVTSTTARVDFILTGRCVENTLADFSRATLTNGEIGGCPAISSSANSYPDVPSDLICTGTCNTSTQRTPAFFKQKRLARVDTSVKVGSAWEKVAAHSLYATYPLPAGATGRTLWLDGVYTRYLGGEAGSNPAADDLVTYAIVFDGTLMNNRVDWTTEAGKLQKRRLTGIRNEFGGYVKVHYDRQATPGTTGGACTLAGRPNAKPADSASDTWYRDSQWECFRVKASDGNYGLYHKYLVSSVELIDTVGGQPTQTFTYEYSQTETPHTLWTYADSILLSRNPSDVDKQDFNTFIGYPVVEVTTGSGSSKSSTVTYYHQGRKGTWNGDSSTVANGIGATLDLPTGFADPQDAAALRGRPALVQRLDALDRVTSETLMTYNVVTVADGRYNHDATVVQTPLVTTTRYEYGSGSVESRTSTVETVYDMSTVGGRKAHPWLAIESTSTPDVAAPTENVSRTTTTYSFDDSSHAAHSEWSASSKKPFFHLAVAGASYMDPGDGEVLTGEWETSYLESGNVVRGLPTMERQRVTNGTGPEAWLESTAQYDSYGRIVQAKGPAETENDTSVSWSYSTDGSLRKVSLTNQLGWVSHQWFEPRFGNLVKYQDANGDFTHYTYDTGGLLVAGYAPRENNREADGDLGDAPDGSVPATAYFGYDIYASVLAARTTPVVVLSAQFVNRTSSGTWVSLAEASTVRRSYEFLDGFGRTIESHAVAPDDSGGRLVTQTDYDDVGRAFRSSDPYFDSSAPAQAASGLKNGDWATIPRYSETSFDASGRVATTTLKAMVDSVQISTELSSIAYALDTVETTQSTTGARTLVENDTLGRTVKQTQYPETGWSTAPIETRYQYEVTASGSIVTVIDDADRETVFESDLGGRRVGLTDPNSGESAYTYNAAGQVEQIVTAAGTVSLAYDPLGRLVERSTLDPEAQPSSSAQWAYDPTGHKGAVASESATTVTPAGAFTVVKTLSYDALHQVVGQTVTLPSTTLLGELSGVSYDVATAYDGTGAPISVTYEGIGGLPEQTVTTGLDILGRARTLTVADSADTRTLVSATSFDSRGRLAGRTFGNGVERTYAWDAMWRALTHASASFDDNGTVLVQSDVYNRDATGRVTSIVDGARQLAQCFTYDGFNRLAQAWSDATYSTPCATAPTVAAQPTGDDAALAYAVAYNYEPTGQVTSITQLISGATSVYAYGDTAHPNAVAAVEHETPVDDDPETPEIDESLTPAASADAFAYDDAGRMVSRVVAGQAATALTWDVSSNLVATTGQGGDRVYLYDASGQRVAQVSVGNLETPTPVSATVYIGATEATDPDTASGSPDDVTATRFYALGGSTVATATAATGSAPVWALLFGDIQGSASVSMELVADTSVTSGFEPASITHEVVRDAYMPYGAARGDGATTDDLAVDRGWLGQYEDVSTGLTYLNARYYDPILGRFLSPDPLMNPGDPRTLDPYRYADNNPISYVDDTGLCSGLSGDAIKKCALAYANAAANSAKSVAAGKAKVAEGKAKTNNTPTPPKPSQPALKPPSPTPSGEPLPGWWDTPLREYFTPEQLEMLDGASPSDQERYIKVWAWNAALRETYVADYPDKTGWINASIHATMYNFGYSVESETFEFALQNYHYRLWRAGAREATGQAPMAGLNLATESLKETMEIAASVYYGGTLFKPGFETRINSQWIRDGWSIGDTLMNFGDLGKVDDFSFPFYME